MPTPTTLNLSEHLLGHRVRDGQGGRRALLTPDGTWTYAEVDALASRWAAVLRDRGMRPGERVLLALPDGPDYVAALFGVLRGGGVVVMVNPELGTDELQWMFGYTEAPWAVVDRSVAGAFREALAGVDEGPTLLVAGDADTTAALDAADPDAVVPHPAAPDDPALWLFSGGTTGRPKGVVQTHRSFVNTTECYGHGILEMVPDDVTLSVPKLYFGYATGSNLFFPFSVGATVSLFPERCTPEALFDRIEAFRPTVLINVPTMINKLLAHPGAAERDLSSLRVCTSAGEALPEALHQRWRDAFGVPLLDGLGTAEMWHIFISNRLGDVKPGTLGKVVPGFTVRACDDDGNEVAPGEVGTMRVQGDSLGLGYWKHPDRTAAAFRDGWYVSSDMIRIDADGYVTYCGRADDMIKVSGKWFAPGELENCLLEHEAVREVAVVAVTDDAGLVKPRAFVVPQEGVEPGPALAEALQAWAKERLQPYKYPREVVFLADFPRTHLGKVDRGALARS
ncbi:MAG: benzoate-CoA ligase family protein [Longimicrobiales bacterium]